MIKTVKPRPEVPAPVTAQGNALEEMAYDPDTGTLVLTNGLGPPAMADCRLDAPSLGEAGAAGSEEDENQTLEGNPEEPASETGSVGCDKGDDLTEPILSEAAEGGSRAESLQKETEVPRRERPWVQAPRSWISFTILCVLALGYYLFQIDCYRAEFHIIYPPAVSNQGEQRIWSLEKELRVFESPALAYLVAQELLAGQSGKSAVDPNGNVSVSYPAESGDTAVSTPPQRLSDSGKLVKWLSSNLEVCPNPAKGIVVVSLAGSDPNFLQAVLDSYIRQYHGYVKHASLEHESYQDTRSDLGQSEGPESSRSGRRSVNPAESQVQECESALGEIGSGKGMFRGFLSDEHLNAVPSLKTLQAKIVELEIEKIALMDHFSSESREVREKELQIKKLRNAMQECLVQHLSSLKRKVAALAAEKTQLERKIMHEQSSKGIKGTLCVGNPFADGSHQKSPENPGCVKAPFISRQPIIVTLTEYLAEGLGCSQTKGVRVLETKGGSDTGLSPYAKPAGSGLEGK
jgi:hypothetical protein